MGIIIGNFQGLIKKAGGGAKSLLLTSPNGGESWISGSSHDIVWEASSIDTLDLYYSINNGTDWSLVDENITASLGSYSWTIPVAISSTCLVKIIEHGGEIEDQSDAVFTIGFGAAVAFYIDSNAGAPRWNDACGAIASANVSYTNDSGTDKSLLHTLGADSHGLNNADVITSDNWNTVMRILNENMGPLKGITGTSFSIIVKWKTDATPNGYLQWMANTDTSGYWLQAHPQPQQVHNVSTGAWNATKVITQALSASTWYFGHFGFDQSTNKIYVEMYDVSGNLLATGNGPSYGGNYNPATSTWRYKPRYNALTVAHYIHFNKFASAADIANAIVWANTY